jgi:hypothetical protein
MLECWVNSSQCFKGLYCLHLHGPGNQIFFSLLLLDPEDESTAVLQNVENNYLTQGDISEGYYLFCDTNVITSNFTLLNPLYKGISKTSCIFQ